ncbi:hypothetical protein DYB37_002573 [Aphanomyces astaci]|uniref:PDEase domain-containing protein n=1 Tax=Aphanomyces astaci TaxID=112090 RepID=A0A3R6Y8V1_APHAT|nr:hypothetical protein DYB37_002573 [Aphanomyces astaci]
MLVAALCHDIGHPGTDNAYEIATGSALAIQYNDMSVLEQHHASETFRILHLPACNILLGVSKPGYQTIRKLVIDGILQTDMKCHFDLVHDLEDAVSQFISSVLRCDSNDLNSVFELTHVLCALYRSSVGKRIWTCLTLRTPRM